LSAMIQSVPGAALDKTCVERNTVSSAISPIHCPLVISSISRAFSVIDKSFISLEAH